MISVSTSYRRAIELVLVWVIALHSVAVMVFLTFAPGLAVELGRFGAMDDLFFVRQGGIFHVVVGVGYLLEYQRYGQTSFIVFSKATAVVFLAVSYAFWSATPLVLLALVGDFTMGLAMYLVSGWVRLGAATAPGPRLASQH